MSIWLKHNGLAVALAGGLAMAGFSAQAQSAAANVPDPQIESNVLKALASAPDLATQNIQSSTVYGTVTLSGNVHDEALRVKAENLVARAQGVKKVVDQLTLGDTPAAGSDQSAYAQPNQQPDSGSQPVLQSDGTYAPAPDGSGSQSSPDTYAAASQPAPGGRQALAGQYAPPQGVPGGQAAGVQVIVPVGSVLRVRINRGLDSQHLDPGTAFDGTVLTDVVADNAVAIPRGASVSGVVVDVKKAGTFKGQGEISLQINSVTLGGQVYPVQTDVWGRTGRDKTAGTVNNTVATGAVGALFGAILGGGTGAAIGAGVGAGAGLAGAAASPRGQIIIQPESVLTFKTAAPVTVKTVSEQEMARLSYSAGPQQPAHQPMRRYYSPGYGYYYAPGPPPPQN